MEGLTFEESVLRLIQMIVFDKQEEIRDRVVKRCKEDPLSCLFGKKQINTQGQTIFSLPPLDIQNPEKDSRLLELHMHQNVLKNSSLWEIYG